MITDIFLVPHSHTDIGYTHPQPVVLELHRRFLDQALALTEDTAHHTDGSAFRWMVEVSGTALDWWRHVSSSQRDRFLSATRAGRIEVGAMRWNQAQLSDHHMLIEAMRPVRELRDAGVPIRSAMNSDVNGVNWGVVEVMLDHGIEAFSMATNEHFGHAVRPRPQAFRWQSPTGRSLLVHNGLMYGSTVSGWLGIPTDIEKTRQAVPLLASLLEQRGYPHSVLIMQATNVHIHDNATPNPALPAHVRSFNSDGGPIRLHISTLSAALDRLREDNLEGIPTLKGDWPDWWTFGAGGSTRETSVAMAAQRALRDAQQLAAWSENQTPRYDLIERRAGDALGFFVEHTFTADRASRRPDSLEVDSQLSWKKTQAYEAFSLARMLRRDGLAELATHDQDAPLTALFYNPLPFPVRRSLRIPKPQVTRLIQDPAAHFVQRQDVEFSDYLDDDMMMVAVDLPALGFSTELYDDLRPAPGRLRVSDTGLANDHLSIRFDARSGGATSLEMDGVQRIDPDWSVGFGVPVLESPVPATRAALFTPPSFVDMAKSLDLHAQWHTDWTARREAGRLVHTRTHQGDGFADLVQVFTFSSGEIVDVRYRLACSEATLSIDVTIDKQRQPSPHAFYLPLPMAEDGAWRVHYETAGAMVELDNEQLPGSNHHFVTTQRVIRLQGETRGVTLATPDVPLFQVGGFTFGRHESGAVRRDHPVLLAWLNNNYWDVNFEVTQSGPLRARFHLCIHEAESIGKSMRRALPYVTEQQLHILKALASARAGLFEIDCDDILITGFDRRGNTLQLYLLNPDRIDHELRLAPGALTPVSASLTALDGSPHTPCIVRNGTFSVSMVGGAWVGLQIKVL